MEAQIRAAIETAMIELDIERGDFSVEHPMDPAHGDYATNVAMVCAKRLGASPRELAERFIDALTGKIEHVTALEIAGPGFINFRLSREFFAKRMEEAVALGDSYGKNDRLTGEVILFEYTSPNLFKPLHIGNLVGNIAGEAVSRLLEFSGGEVYRINYPSDIGLTVAKGVWGLRKTNGDPKDIQAIGEAYRTGNEAYESDPSAKDEIEAVNRALYSGEDESLNRLRNDGIETSHGHLTELCRMLGTTFDAEIRESEASDIGTKIVREHTGDVFEESDGAIIFPGEKYGLHTRVFLNSQGLPTYEAKDMGNFALKALRYPSWTQSIIVTGGEQREYFRVLFEAIRKVFPETVNRSLIHVATGFLSLTSGKMSSRKGNVLTGESLLNMLQEEAKVRAAESRADDIETLAEQVAVGALKYQILRQGIGQDIIFDKDRALSLEGDSGPYLMYTHARMSSIQGNAAEAGINASADRMPEEPYALERLVYQFPEITRKAQASYAPHHLVVYLTELASAFNAFYANEKIVDSTDAYAPYKLLVTQAVYQTMKNGLTLLGIAAPERM